MSMTTRIIPVALYVLHIPLVPPLSRRKKACLLGACAFVPPGHIPLPTELLSDLITL